MLDAFYGFFISSAMHTLPISVVAWLGFRLGVRSTLQGKGNSLLGSLYSFLATWALIAFSDFSTFGRSALMIHTLSFCLLGAGVLASIIRMGASTLTHSSRRR